jgi:hypothetical protein
MSNRRKHFYMASLIVLLCITNIYAVSVIPGEKGFGMETPAGRGGEIYKVTNLNPSGSGSLKECIDSNGPRYCIFEVSGTIQLKEHLKITNPYITIAGQTAPSPGITIKGAGIVIQASDVLIQHLRIRVGDESVGPAYDDRDAIKIEAKNSNIKNIVIDHVSASWATDEVFSTWSYPGKWAKEITVTNSIFSEGLYDSNHPDGRHSMGVIIGKNTQDLLFNKNILAYNNYRNPLIREDSTDIIVANNYLHNPGVGSKSKIYFGTTGPLNTPMRASVVGNVFTSNPSDYYDNMVYVESGSASSFGLYLNDNLGPLGTKDPWACVMGITSSSIRETSPPVSVKGLSYMSSAQVKNFVFENAGARPADRDAVDERIIANMKAGKGSIIDSQKDVGGWPNLAQNTRRITIPANPHVDSNGNGYTNLEELLHQYSAAVENRGSSDVINLEPTTPSEPSSSSDTKPPVISDSMPQAFPSGTTTVTLKVATDETAYCHYDTRPGIHYLNQQIFFDGALSRSHTSVVDNLVDGTYTYYVKCRDIATPKNYNMQDYIITFTIGDNSNAPSEPSSSSDTKPPVISESMPKAFPSGTTSVTLKVTTDETAYCHYDTRPGIHYLNQQIFFDGALSRSHTSVVDNLVDGNTYTYYVRCRDIATPRNYNMQDYIITFSVEGKSNNNQKSSSSSSSSLSSFSGTEVDKSPPVITDSMLQTYPAGTSSVLLEVETDELAFCHYDTKPGIDYLSQTGIFKGINTKHHTAVVGGLSDGNTYTYYIRCRDPCHSKKLQYAGLCNHL